MRRLLRTRCSSSTGSQVGNVGDVLRGSCRQPLSPQQRRLKSALEQVPGLPARVVVAAQVDGTCAFDALEGTLRRAVQRHDILRTRPRARARNGRTAPDRAR